jgi:hypothetical protein
MFHLNVVGIDFFEEQVLAFRCQNIFFQQTVGKLVRLLLGNGLWTDRHIKKKQKEEEEILFHGYRLSFSSLISFNHLLNLLLE